ncbi:hypothetical protein LSAT2_023242 [Lamellibrachia satsuma]|nr:hypothetical protein LSAT2_023242 [Lamellibrachia satsuma]
MTRRWNGPMKVNYRGSLVARRPRGRTGGSAERVHVSEAYRKMDMTREHISLIFELTVMFLSLHKGTPDLRKGQSPRLVERQTRRQGQRPVVASALASRLPPIEASAAARRRHIPRTSDVLATWPARAVFTFDAIRGRPPTPLVLSDPARVHTDTCFPTVDITATQPGVIPDYASLVAHEISTLKAARNWLQCTSL